jgi:CIC family chloride channel protein
VAPRHDRRIRHDPPLRRGPDRLRLGSLPADTPNSTAGPALWRSAHGVLPVVIGGDEHFHGCVTARALAEALTNTESTDHTVADLAQMPPKITENSTLSDALHALAGAEGTPLG